jgi:hypothetical protein
VPINIDFTPPCLGGKVRNETTGECECPPGKRENSLGICVDPIDDCPSGQQRNAAGVCEDIPNIDSPDVDLPDLPEIPLPSGPVAPSGGMMKPSTPMGLSYTPQQILQIKPQQPIDAVAQLQNNSATKQIEGSIMRMLTGNRDKPA